MIKCLILLRSDNTVTPMIASTALKLKLEKRTVSIFETRRRSYVDLHNKSTFLFP